MSRIDRQAIELILQLERDGSAGLFLKMRTAFVSTFEQGIVCIGESINTADMANVSRSAHQLKSSAAYLGAKSLSETCRKIEVFAREGGDTSRIKPLLAELQREYPEVKRELDQFNQSPND